ncbi:MAG: hydrolase, partial [Chloroflexota bacterium]|nr:hydrolase [Chloroflexota bacterium]
MVPQTQYAKKGDAHIAYQIVGEGNQLDIVLVSTWFSHVEARWDLPGYAHYLSRLASFSRLISFDKYGIGLSDPIRSSELPPLEDWMDDVSAVMDAVGLERAAIAGAGEASPMAELFAATYPERTSALVLMNATARVSAAPGYEIGAPPEVQEGLVSMVEQTWGRGDIIAAINPSLAGDAAAIEAWGRFLRLSASPATAAAVMRMLFELDVRDVLPSIRVPTLVVHRRDNPIVTVDQGRYVAEHIEGATFVAVPGADYGLGVGDIDVLIDEVEEFLTGSRPAHATDRVLATVLFTDIVDSTPRAVELGDARWRELLERHDELAATEVARFGGTISDFAGDGLLATFDGPARAVRCAFALRDRLRTLDLDMRAGLHTRHRRPYRRSCERARRSGRSARVADGEGPRYGLRPLLRRTRRTQPEGRSRSVGDPRSSRVTSRHRPSASSTNRCLGAHSDVAAAPPPDDHSPGEAGREHRQPHCHSAYRERRHQRHAPDQADRVHGTRPATPLAALRPSRGVGDRVVGQYTERRECDRPTQVGGQDEKRDRGRDRHLGVIRNAVARVHRGQPARQIPLPGHGKRRAPDAGDEGEQGTQAGDRRPDADQRHRPVGVDRLD